MQFLVEGILSNISMIFFLILTSGPADDCSVLSLSASLIHREQPFFAIWVEGIIGNIHMKLF